MMTKLVGFTKLFFVNLPGMSFKNLYKRIQVSWLYLIWLSLLADLFSVSRTKALNTTNYMYTISMAAAEAYLFV